MDFAVILSGHYICLASFSVLDPPSALDENLPDIAKFLSVHLENDSNFYKFGAQLVSHKKIDVKGIQQDTTKARLEDKCLELIELWIRSVKDSKWSDLLEAAEKSGFGGLVTALIAELYETSVKVANRGNYKHNYYVVSIDTIQDHAHFIDVVLNVVK